MTHFTAQDIAQIMRDNIKQMPARRFKNVTVSVQKNIITVANMHHMAAIDLARQCCPHVSFKAINACKIEVKETMDDRAALKTQFKESYYVIGDKLIGLGDVAESFDGKTAERKEIEAILVDIYAAKHKLKAWADRNLTNWD
jgi:hypothetical protein